MSEISPLRKLSDMPLTCSACKACAAQGCEMRSQEWDRTATTFSRRTLVAGAAGTVAFSTLGGQVLAQDTVAGDAASTPEACVALTPEMTEGPYYIDDLLLRDDITEGRPGVPLELTVRVIDTVSCEHLPDAAVDIWHCDALGDYSGISGQMGNDDTSGQTWLRGVQLTDQNGAATITTIYPGWYVGRCTHIHIKVHTGGTAEDGTYIGGTTAHTGQLYFDDEITDQIAQLEPYVQRIDVARTRNDEDSILGGAGTNEAAFFITLTPKDENDLTQGFTGTALLGVDPSAVSTQTGNGGGSLQPGNGGPGGRDGNDGPPPGDGN